MATRYFVLDITPGFYLLASAVIVIVALQMYNWKSPAKKTESEVSLLRSRDSDTSSDSDMPDPH